MGAKVGDMKKALVVDDDAQVRSEISLCLQALGWSSTGMSLSRALGGLAGPETEVYSLAFLPVSFDGFPDLSRSIRKAAQGCLVIALADLDRENELRSAVFSGLADDFLPLPFSPNDLKGLCKLSAGRSP